MITWVSLGAMVIVLSIGLAALLIYRAANPWAGAMLEIRRLEKNGPRYYRPHKHSGRAYSHVQQACYLIESRRYAAAAREVASAQRLDSLNPLLDYLAAVAAAQTHGTGAALSLIDQGNAKGTVRLYVDDDLSPEDWRWPEVKLVCYLGNRITKERPGDRSAITSVLVMTQKLIWAEPPDSLRILQALQVRQAAATCLKRIAAQTHDRELLNLHSDLVEEARRVRWAEERHQTTQTGENRAWIISRAVGREAAGTRRLLRLQMLEKSAEWADQLRRDYIRRRDLTSLLGRRAEALRDQGSVPVRPIRVNRRPMEHNHPQASMPASSSALASTGR